MIAKIFRNSYRAYGTRRIQETLKKEEVFISRRRIARIMKMNQWISKYTMKKYRPSKDVNEANHQNIIH